jgi:hypothetical protein
MQLVALVLELIQLFEIVAGLFVTCLGRAVGVC